MEAKTVFTLKVLNNHTFTFIVTPMQKGFRCFLTQRTVVNDIEGLEDEDDFIITYKETCPNCKTDEETINRVGRLYIASWENITL